MRYNDQDVAILLVGNKCDLEEKREVEKPAGLELANCHDWPFMEASAKIGFNIDIAFEALILRMVSNLYMCLSVLLLYCIFMNNS